MKNKLNNISVICICLAGFFLILPTEAAGQNYKTKRQELLKKQRETRSEIDILTGQIEKFEDRLALADEKFELQFEQYQDLKRLIALQSDKINKLEKEQTHIREEMVVTEKEIERNRERLDYLIDHYKKTLTYLYKHGRTSSIALLLTAGSVNQMLVRAYYLDKFESYREKQVTDIRTVQNELEDNRINLKDAQNKNRAILVEIRNERALLSVKIDQQKKNVEMLRDNREKISEKLSLYRRQMAKLNNTLTALILEDERVRKKQLDEIRLREEQRKRNLADAKTIEDEEERAAKIAEYSKPIREELFIDEETLMTFENSFESQKGILNWPVDNGTITEHFGKKRHPVYGTITQNLGVEIVTEPKNIVRVVHDGYVTDVIPITGFGDVVLVSHGDYKTVYGNLSQVMVKKDMILKKGDAIGLSGVKDSAKGETVFFMVRKGTKNLDPEVWLAKN